MTNKKLATYSKKDQKQITREVDSQVALLGIDDYYGPIGRFDTLDNEFGLCKTCKEFQFAKTEFAVVRAQCRDLDIVLHSEQPIKACTNYIKIGQLTINQMLDMATLIEINKKKIGFETQKEE